MLPRQHIVDQSDALSSVPGSVFRVHYGFLFLLLLMPMEWYRVPMLGYKSIVWLPLIPLILLLALSPSLSINRFVAFLSTSKWMHCSYVAYLVVLTFATLWGPSLREGLPQLKLAMNQFFFYLIVGTVLFGTDAGTVRRTILWGVPCSLVLFLMYNYYVFSSEGASLFQELKIAASSGESNAIASRILSRVVNFQFSNVSQDNKLEIVTAVRNTISATLSCFLFLLLVSSKGEWTNLLFLLSVMMIPILIVIIMSRSSLLTILFAPVFCYAMRLLLVRVSSNFVMLPCLFVLVLGCLLTGLLTAGGESDFVSLNYKRMRSISEDARVVHYHLAFEAISRSPWLGQGLGADTPDGRLIHNLFLGSWFRAGIIGLGVSIAWYCTLVGSWIRKSVQIQTESFWIPALLIAPVLRSPLIGGLEGRLTRAEWLAVATFFYLFNQHKKTKEVIQATQKTSD